MGIGRRILAAAHDDEFCSAGITFAVTETSSPYSTQRATKAPRFSTRGLSCVRGVETSSKFFGMERIWGSRQTAEEIESNGFSGDRGGLFCVDLPD
jgi:hypothetical protein